MVTANSRNTRPTMPPISSTGMNTAISEKVIDTMVKPISREPFSAASNGRMPPSMWRTMFSSMTMASSTTKPTDSVSASSVMLLIEKSKRVHHGAGADQRDRHRQRRNDGRRRRAQEQEDHQDDQRRRRSAAFPARRRPHCRIEIERSIRRLHVDRRPEPGRGMPAAWRLHRSRPPRRCWRRAAAGSPARPRGRR